MAELMRVLIIDDTRSASVRQVPGPGQAVVDARGKITSHRACWTIATQLCDAKER